MNKIIDRLRAGLLMLVVIALPAGADETAASDAIVRLQAGLLAVMKAADQLGYPGRYQSLERIVNETHDLAYIGKLILKRYWETIDREQQSRYLATFRELTIATYAGRFDGYAGERFVVLDKVPLTRGRMQVKSQLIKPDGSEVNFNYIMHRSDGAWRIVNIVVDGVSDIALRRTQYNAVMKTDGIEVLLGRLQEIINGYASPNGD